MSYISLKTFKMFDSVYLEGYLSVCVPGREDSMLKNILNLRDHITSLNVFNDEFLLGYWYLKIKRNWRLT